MNATSTTASSDDAALIQYMSSNAASDGKTSPAAVALTDDSTAASTALDIEPPMARMSELSPLAEADSVIGTWAMIRVGMAANETAAPMPTRLDPSTTSTTEPVAKTRNT